MNDKARLSWENILVHPGLRRSGEKISARMTRGSGKQLTRILVLHIMLFIKADMVARMGNILRTFGKIFLFYILRVLNTGRFFRKVIYDYFILLGDV